MTKVIAGITTSLDGYVERYLVHAGDKVLGASRRGCRARRTFMAR